ncbi:MAG TPA: M56 family metallopeptidase, partial [Pirellulales bacterium]|nr:M56 family metallopeptidase [Pirellulales bacterium]
MPDAIDSSITLINRLGEVYWDFAWVMFVQVSVLACVLFVLDLVLRRKVRAVIRYWIWLLVFARLILPTDLRTPVSLAYWLPAGENSRTQRPGETAEWSTDTPMIDRTGTIDAATEPLSDSLSNSSPEAKAKAAPENLPPGDVFTAPLPPAASASRVQLDWKGMIFIAWGTVVAILLVLLAWRAGKVRALVAAAGSAPGELEALLGECLPKVAMVRGQLRLRITNRLGSPALCGFFRPTILLPSHSLAHLDREQIRLIFWHELVHWKRGDLQLNYLQTVLQILYFYHPAVWLTGCMVRRLREEAVDETVLVIARGDADRYASTLLDLAAMALDPAESMLRLVGVVESRAALAGRIRRIVARPLPKTSKVGLTGLAAILALGLLLVPMARSERPADQEQP